MVTSEKDGGGSRARGDRVIARNITFSLNRRSISLKPGQVDMLVASLRQLSSPDADAVADEIGDLALAGVRVDLRLSAAELDALASAVIDLTAPLRKTDPAFARLLAYVREEEAR